MCFLGLLAKVTDSAEKAAQKIQAKAESVGFKNVSGDIAVGFYRKGSTSASSGGTTPGTTPPGSAKKPAKLHMAEMNLTMETTQLLLSLLHAWGLDFDLDKVCETKLGLLRPMRPVCFGLLSRGGHMSLFLPTYIHKLDGTIPNKIEPTKQVLSRTKSDAKHVKMAPALPPELMLEEERARRFASRFHWELSTAVTTNHLLSIIAIANTLMSMNNASFVVDQERRRKLYRKLSRSDSTTAPKGKDFSDV